MVSSVSVSNASQTPVFVYDGECGFCLRWIALWRELTEGRVEFSPASDKRFPEIPEADCDRSSQFIDTDGKVYTGAEAVFRMFRYAHGKGAWLWAWRHVRGFEQLSEWVYARVAANRSKLSRLNRLLFSAELPALRIVRGLLLRLLGLVYLCAFGSFWMQAKGLIGSTGILPVEEFMGAAGQQLAGMARWHQLPTLAWWSASDAFLMFQCGAGTILAVVLMIGLLPVVVVPLLWLFWLSLTVAGQEFMGYQWENLLLESGFLAIFLAPISLTVGRGERPPALVIFLFRWLIFRLMFMSGAVKLLSGDPAWSNFTALFYHFETQPLPTLLGWHVHQLPSWFLVFQTGVMFLIEIGFAFLIFARRKVRLIAFAGFLLLQAGIALTGNYGYFNLLTVVLCVLLLDDRVFTKSLEGRPRPLRTWRNSLLISRSILLSFAAAVIFLVSSMQLISGLRLKTSWPRPLLELYALSQPFRSVNGYGLFAVMTTKRPEIIVQGSNDQQTWRDYVFSYKPGPLERAPGFIAPHQPRLDWQMWFAALGNYQENRWFTRFCLRLMQGSPEVLALLKENPFAGKPPRYLRALIYDYEFTSRAERAATGQYWVRTNERVYLPMVSLEPEQAGERPLIQ